MLVSLVMLTPCCSRGFDFGTTMPCFRVMVSSSPGLTLFVVDHMPVGALDHRIAAVEVDWAEAVRDARERSMVRLASRRECRSVDAHGSGRHRGALMRFQHGQRLCQAWPVRVAFDQRRTSRWRSSRRCACACVADAR